jgi:hypothetical protein
LTHAQAAELEAGMDRYAVLVYHDQRFTDDQQKAFSLNFGPLEQTAGGNVTKAADQRLDPDVADVSNLGADHKPLVRTIAGGCSTSGTGCGIPTVRSEPFRRSIRCCRVAQSLMPAATRNLPTCARLTPLR